MAQGTRRARRVAAGPRLGRRPLALAILVVALAVQALALYSPVAPGGPDLPMRDKVAHVLVFAVPALAAAGAFRRRWPTWLLLACHAPISELVQGRVLSDRVGDPWDVVADLLGIAVGASAGLIWARRDR